MMQKINSNRHFKHFVAYSLVFVIYGMIQIGLGPLIPYLAYNKGINQTQYSFLFLSRSIAFITCGFIIKLLTKIMNLHTMGIFGCLISGIFYILFSFTDDLLWLGIFIFFGALGTCILEVNVNMGMLLSHSNNQVQFWMQLTHGMFGIGGLLGPLFVYLFETNVYVFMAIMMLPLSLVFHFLKSPDMQDFHKNQQVKQQSKQLLQQKQRINYAEVPHKIQYLVCTMFFLYIGLQCSVGGWISSYAVIQKVETKERATIYSSIFWMAITAFRFLTPFLPGSISTKIQYCIIASVSSCFICSFLVIFDYNWFAIIFCGYMLGFSLASQFPLYLTWPSQYKMQFNTKQSANIMIFAMLGQAGPSVIIGFLMGAITPNMLFYSLLIISIALYFLFKFTLKYQEQCLRERQKNAGVAKRNQLIAISSEIELRSVNK